MFDAARHRSFEPLLLLAGAGGCIGMIFPMAKVAGAQGLSPLTYACLSCGLACGLLAVYCRFSGEPLRANRGELRYALVAGQLTFAIPFGTLIAVIPLIGSGIPAILQSMAPMATLAIATMIGFETAGRLRLIGLVVGFAGALLVLLVRDTGSPGAGGDWHVYTAALVTPIALAAGNVFRSTHWPAGSAPLPLAVLTLAAAALGLAVFAMVLRTLGLVGPLAAGLADGWPLVLGQSLLTGIGYALFFRLQKVGGPIYLSQISYVNTAVGLLVAVVVLGERLPPAAWVAMLLIAIGIAIVSAAGRAR